MDQALRWPLWAPVAFGSGAAIYFGLRAEPAFWVCAGLLVTGLAGVAAGLRWQAGRGVLALLVLAACLGGGLFAAKARTVAVRAPILGPVQVAHIDGWVVDVAPPSDSGQRLVIAPVAINDIAPQGLPNRIRVTTGPGGAVAPGTPIRLMAGLNPPPSPAAPGAYDFARAAYFDGIGAVGFSLGDPVIIDLPRPPLAFRVMLAVNAFRWDLTRQIADTIGGAAGGVAAAMITGEAAYVPPGDNDAMRDAGVSHIVSISGVHMAIVGGFMFFLTRLLIAAVPALALRINGKKAAAITGLVAILVYLVVSGAPPAAERAAITAGVAFSAILLDRRAVTLRGLALAAFLVLLFEPEAVTQPGFQMSFAATTALVALAEAWPRRPRPIRIPWWIRAIQGAGAWATAGLSVSLVAGMATTPFIIQHFNRVSVYGLPANLIVEGLSSFVFMPTLALGAVLQTVGLGKPFLIVAGWGIDLMLKAAHAFAAAPHATFTIASAPNIALPVAFVGLLWMCLWRGRGRWLGLPFALAVSLWPRPPVADVWVAADGGAAAVVRDGKAYLMRPESHRFASDLWAHRRGLEVVEDKAELAAFYECSRWRCVTRSGPRVAAWFTRRKPGTADLDLLCRPHSLFISKATTDCAKGNVVGPDDLGRGGAAELRLSATGWTASWSQSVRGARPWTQAAQ